MVNALGIALKYPAVPMRLQSTATRCGWGTAKFVSLASTVTRMGGDASLPGSGSVARPTLLRDTGIMAISGVVNTSAKVEAFDPRRPARQEVV